MLSLYKQGKVKQRGKKWQTTTLNQLPECKGVTPGSWFTQSWETGMVYFTLLHTEVGEDFILQQMSRTAWFWTLLDLLLKILNGNVRVRTPS